MHKYLGLDYILQNIQGVFYPTVIISDQLVDYTHPELADVIDKVVTIDNNGNIREYSREELAEIDPHDEFWEDKPNSLYPYINHRYNFGHGTHVAGIIHQIAPQARIISVAHAEPRGNYYIVAKAFLEWLDAQKGSGGLRIVNISEGWNEHIIEADRKALTTIFKNIILNGGNRFLFTIVAGNKPYIEKTTNKISWELMYPASLANAWHREGHEPFGTYQIVGKIDVDGGPIFANGILSVGAIHDEEAFVELRDDNLSMIMMAMVIWRSWLQVSTFSPHFQRKMGKT